MKFFTNSHKKFWKERKIDWEKDYLSTWNHPHRAMIASVLASFNWFSLWEVGCGPGANIVRILQSIPGRQLGGSDVNPEAIEVARKTFVGGRFNVESVENLLLSDGAADVMLSDATLIYIDPWKIKKAVHEIARVARTRVILCEFHSTSMWKRWLFRLKTGYNVYDYKKLLEEEGCYDIQMAKITPEFWPGSKPGDGWYEFGYLISARKT